MAASRPSEKFRNAIGAYLHDERFSDFIIVCEEKEFKVHRCFISAHSPFFNTCCSGMFEESKKSRVELKEDLKEVVECMVTFFYTFDYDDSIKADPRPHIQSGRPACEIQMNAHVYAIADKYQIDELKDLALEKFKTRVNLDNGMAVLGGTWTVYKDVKIPMDDNALHNALIDIWLMGAPDWFEQKDEQGRASVMCSFIQDVPEFAIIIFQRMAAGFKSGTVGMVCAHCNRKEIFPRSKARTETFRCKNCATSQPKPDLTLQGIVPVKRFW